MRSVAVAAVAALVLACLCATTATAQQATGARLTVTVLDKETGQPLPGVRVTVTGAPSAAETDSLGRARLPHIPLGTRVLTLSRVGYAIRSAAVEFEAAAEVEAEVDLTPQPIELEGLYVTSWGRSTKLRRNGFYERREQSGGSFLSRQDVERIRPFWTTDLFRYMRGFYVAPSATGTEDVVLSSRGGGLDGPCQPLIYIDGFLTSPDVLRTLSPSDIEGVEAYAGLGNIPAQYNVTGSACGVILVWTR